MSVARIRSRKGDFTSTGCYRLNYVFYNRAHLVRPLEGAREHGNLRRALFDRTWEHFRI
jgi:hypothetical protein